MNFYHPQTKERITTNHPADWMGQTEIDPPAYDPLKQGCFWRGTDWEIVEPEPEQRDVKTEIAQMEARQMMPRVTREFMLGLIEAQYTPEQRAQNIGYTKLKALDDEIRTLRDLL